MRPTTDSGEGYPKGSIVLCQSCLKPLYVLERGIGPGSKAGRSVDAFRPFEMLDFSVLAHSMDAGVSAQARAWTTSERAEHCRKITRPKAGDPMLCPACGHSYTRVVADEAAEVIDRAYVVELVTIPPGRTLQGREARAWAR